ncbi:hypothetical protein BT96DRAFT_962255 [Gymnopus androsaceus JB14]|uniref:Mid2 domain-containing protein n=1 Tax=Gymnopus androsaceus JB14 TaxID=1447944 RepID=A0A6A4IGG0_9AGAR|nr:hypothetical protein BT96DRAFT_962255 [Gymnopus androsaceus JB14]
MTEIARLALKVLLLLDLLPFGALAYTWSFQSTPTQCSNLSIAISGGGTPPFNVLIIPSGSTPFSNGTEVRRIISKEFSTSSISFPINYPENSQFVAVVSDATGFGSGGTSAEAEVETSSDSSCIDASQSVTPDWFLSIENQAIVQCTPARIFWNPSNVTGTPTFFGIIPGGDSFIIPEVGINTTTDGTGTGFSWTPNIREGTILNIVGNDNRGNGTGGSSSVTVSQNLQNDNSCLNSTSPSSTAGSPAGGSYPTSTSGASTGSSSSSGGTNVGAIVGGVVGGVVGLLALLLLLYFIRRRTRQNAKNNEKPVDLLQADEGDERPNRPAQLPEYYQPDPFIVPDPTSGDESGSSAAPFSSSSERPTSSASTHDATSSSARKSAVPRTLRPVNIVQHDDAGAASTTKEEEPETIELPPAYTNIRK